jgi:hypothetical protein
MLLVATAVLAAASLPGARVDASGGGVEPSRDDDPTLFREPSWLPFRGSYLIGCVRTNCGGGGHGDWAIDIPMAVNDPVYSTASGQVELAVANQGGNCNQNVVDDLEDCPEGSEGNAVLIDHGGGVYSFYGHLRTVMVHNGEMVSEGTVIGGAGNSGWTDPSFVHLHYEEWQGLLWEGGERTEPRDLKGCHGGTSVTYPGAAGGSEWDDLTGFRVTLRHDGACNPNGPDCTSDFIDVLGGHSFCDEIEWMVDGDITGGFADGLFHPTATATRQASVAWLYRLAGEPGGPFPDPGFTDVPASHPFRDEIAWAVSEGIVAGYPDGTFKGDREVTRQAFVTFLYRLAGEPAPPFPNPGFSDLLETDPFFDEIAWGVDNGIVDGYADGRFKGGADIARQAGAAFLFRFDDL